jgi:CDP-diglyceride synthetase
MLSSTLMVTMIITLYFSGPLLIWAGLILAICIFAIIKVIKLWKLNKIARGDLIIVFIITLTLFGFLYTLYPEEKAFFSIIFIGPLSMVLVPYILHVLTHNKKKENYISKLSVITIVFSIIGTFIIPIIYKLFKIIF